MDELDDIADQNSHYFNVGTRDRRGRKRNLLPVPRPKRTFKARLRRAINASRTVRKKKYHGDDK